MTALNENSSTSALNVTTLGVSGTGNLALNNNGALASGISISGPVNNTGTLSNTGTGTGSTVISGAIGANVTTVTENSATSSLIIDGNNSYTGGTVITAGTLQLGNGAGIGGNLSTGPSRITGRCSSTSVPTLEHSRQSHQRHGPRPPGNWHYDHFSRD